MRLTTVNRKKNHAAGRWIIRSKFNVLNSTRLRALSSSDYGY